MPNRRKLRPEPSSRRSSAGREPRRLVVVVSEGEKTEKHYLDQLAGEFGALVKIRVVTPNLSPLGMAREAVRLRKGAISQGALRRDDSYWLLMDVDDYGGEIDEAVRLASSNSIHSVVSNPCFEVWLLCHFEFSSAAIDKRDRLLRKLGSKHLPGYGEANKSLKNFALMAKLETAERNAMKLERFHEKNPGTGRNPSTNMWMLVASLRASRA